MRLQEQLVKATQKAVEDVCRSARAVPAEKLDWSPGGDSRSVLNQMQEIATSARWFLPLVRDRKPPVFDEHALEESRRLRKSFDTLDKCITAARESTSELCREIAAFPDSALDQEMSLPFGGGMTVSMADVLMMHYWNATYHLGQINQIQLMLGDKAMH